jgi:hypothetical protein
MRRKEFDMKLNTAVLLVAVAVLVWTGQAQAYTAVSFGISISDTRDFYEPLAPHGYWVDRPQYGRCWYPAYVDQGWRPYSSGHWVWTDDGWYWESEEPWAWATYHYGRWSWDSYYGWVWVPGVEWSPAWVAWREGGGYVGWAPLSPECDFGSSGMIYGETAVVPAQYFIFVEHRHFCERIRPRTVIVNNTVINQTVNITKISRVNQVIINNGPSLEVIERNNPGRVLKTKIEHRIPVEVQQGRQQPWQSRQQASREARPAPRPVPEVVRGTNREADRSVVVRPAAPDERSIQPRPQRNAPERQVIAPEPRPKSESRPPQYTGERRQAEHRAPVPPAAVVVQPKPQPLAPTAVQSPDSEGGKYRRYGPARSTEDDRHRGD